MLASQGSSTHFYSFCSDMEDSHDDDIKRGAEVYLDAARRLLSD